VGYKRNPKVYRLRFQGEYDGLEVMIRSLSMGQLIKNRTGANEEGRNATEDLVELLAKQLISWNLEAEDGTPVPPTLDAIQAEDNDLIFAIINRWMEAVQGVPAPLPESSPSGEPSPVESIPMAPLSESLAS
jgi:hypothetical protein